MNWRGQTPFKSYYLLLLLPTFLAISALIVILFPLRTHALVPELLDSTKSTLTNVRKQLKPLPSLSSLVTPEASPPTNSGGGASTPPKSNPVRSSGSQKQSAPTSTSASSSDAAEAESSVKSKEAAVYPTLPLATAPLETVRPPQATLANAEIDGRTSKQPALLSAGKLQLVLLEPSSEGWQVLGLAWYWWLAGIILLGGGGIAMRELRRVMNVKDGATVAR